MDFAPDVPEHKGFGTTTLGRMGFGPATLGRTSFGPAALGRKDSSFVVLRQKEVLYHHSAVGNHLT